MYTGFFGLTEKPFAITPDPRYLFLSERHAEALAHLAFGVTEAGGFIQLTGEVGTGKTTVLRSLLQQLPPNCEVALVLNPRVTSAEFLHGICDELHLQVPEAAAGSVRMLVDLLTHYLLDAHGRDRRVVLLVDEAQNLSVDVLEQVRLLTNLETATRKLLQIILIGQPELRSVLGRSELRQLAQRITGRYHLEALTRGETSAYVRHRLRVAGATREIFTAGALRELYRLAGGVPRVINVIADRALLGAWSRDEHRVGSELVRRAASEVFGRPVLPPWARWFTLAGATAGAVLLALAAWRMTFAPEPAGVVAAVPEQSDAAAPVTNVAPGLPAPAMQEPVPVRLRERLAQAIGNTTMDTAFAGLLNLWGGQYGPGLAPPCEQAAAHGLACVAQRGSLAELKLINRPAVLALVDAAGTEHQIVLAGLDGDRARLLLAGASLEVAVAELADHWYGDFLVLWRPQGGALRPLRAGMRGDDVRWLRDGLERLGGLPANAAAPELFDAELQRLVEDFQRSRRLAVDGIAGMQTQMVLDAAVGAPGAPTLRPAPTGSGA
ncbi:MAG: hypothetical protein FJ191_10735 [Gammaproteobacteria bacterium]|nr:hypothetical protein [Gammaproteobacteria bacterium]